jgi:predicted DsbA family dithiol-disulfide isomerase
MKNLPLPMHNNAVEAALALQAAGRQGKAWLMYDKMFENQKALAREELERYANDLGLDVAKFKTDFDDPKVKDEVDADLRVARAAGISGTPTFFVNGQPLRGARPFEDFVSVIDDELAKAEALLQQGVPLAEIYEKRAKSK